MSYSIQRNGVPIFSYRDTGIPDDPNSRYYDGIWVSPGDHIDVQVGGGYDHGNTPLYVLLEQ